MIADPSSRRRTFAAESPCPRQRTQPVDLGNEARARSLQRLERERAGEIRRRGESTRAHEPQRAERGHELRAVDERQPFLRREPDRLEPRGGERVRTVEQLALEPRPALPNQRKGEVRKRSEIAARADGAAAGHLRQHVAVQAREDRFHKPDARAGRPLRERVRAEEHRRADDLVGIGLADPARMTAE